MNNIFPNHKSRIISIVFLCIVILGVTFIFLTRSCGNEIFFGQQPLLNSPLLLGQRIKYRCQGDIQKVSGIILHFTDTNTMENAINAMESRQLFVQIIIDKDGKAYQLTDKVSNFSAGATGGNSWGINIEIVGKEVDLEKSSEQKDAQFQSVVATTKFLSDYYQIPITNELPFPLDTQWQGIFSHQQVDAFHPKGGRRGKIDPGETYMRHVMTALKE